jgi:hypothetical protein
LQLTKLLTLFCLNAILFQGIAQEPVEYRQRINEELDITGMDTLNSEYIWIKRIKKYPNDSLLMEQFFYKKIVYKASGDTIYNIEYKETQYYENQTVLSKKEVTTVSVNGHDLDLIIYNWYYNKKGKLLMKEKESRYIKID